MRAVELESSKSCALERTSATSFGDIIPNPVQFRGTATSMPESEVVATTLQESPEDPEAMVQRSSASETVE